MQLWFIYALLSALFAALTAIFAKVGLKNINPDLATAIRTLIILVMTWAIVFFRGVQSISNFTRMNWLFLILSGLATGMSWLFYYRALQIGKVAEVTLVDKGSLVLTILLAFIFLQEPITWRVALGAFLVVCGILVIIWK